ncbi:hypothetical protein Desor_1968 [Desulfosporosinus orientis DSM 765]|uniref:Immunity protein 17 n=1 Tax=Desulfosporosinus orientis (strain ATCC 19365 / DSM 765 / NCIMB 8382 / VKM B-1628 / Singapore I) TaxID=768706 RepID=G7WD98_DESOD|nr:hypothetical protein [Desulfosporosinus orientis]AET67583.1 hypothetical protein Desor_1968 [Desulfosporosinus orientis DSM 765]
MVLVTAILFLAIGLWCVLKPEIVGMFDGFEIKPSTNKYYHDYIKRYGLALFLVGVGTLVYGLLTIVFGNGKP